MLARQKREAEILLFQKRQGNFAESIPQGYEIYAEALEIVRSILEDAMDANAEMVELEYADDGLEVCFIVATSWKTPYNYCGRVSELWRIHFPHEA